MGKVKTDGVKENVEWAATFVTKLLKSRSELHAEIRAKMNLADRHSKAAENKITDWVDALETKVLGTLQVMSTKIA